jgi:hypothetical protein
LKKNALVERKEQEACPDRGDMIMFEKYKIPLIIVGSVIVLVIVSWIANSFPRQSILDDYITKESARIIQQYQADMKVKDDKLILLNAKVTISEKVVTDLNTKIKLLEAKRDNVQIPKTDEETRLRFINLGYPPIQ